MPIFQYVIVGLTVATAAAWAVNRVRRLRKEADPCANCPGCELKKEKRKAAKEKNAEKFGCYK